MVWEWYRKASFAATIFGSAATVSPSRATHEMTRILCHRKTMRKLLCSASVLQQGEIRGNLDTTSCLNLPYGGGLAGDWQHRSGRRHEGAVKMLASAQRAVRISPTDAAPDAN
eukprot:1402857-Amphidinium_carterae.1